MVIRVCYFNHIQNTPQPHPSTGEYSSPPLGGYMPDTPWHCPPGQVCTALPLRCASGTLCVGLHVVPMSFGSAGERSGVVDAFF